MQDTYIYLSDQTSIESTTWAELKEKAMQNNYKNQSWYYTLTPE